MGIYSLRKACDQGAQTLCARLLLMLAPHVRRAMHDMRCQRHSDVYVACRDAEVSQGAWGIDGTRPGSCESSIFCTSKALWHPRSTSPSFGLVAKRLTRCTRHRSRAGAEDGDHVGPGRAGGAPARQDVVFHIKGVGALGRAGNVETSFPNFVTPPPPVFLLIPTAPSPTRSLPSQLSRSRGAVLTLLDARDRV